MKKLLIVVAIALLIGLIILLKPSKKEETLFGIVGYTPIGFPSASVDQMTQYFKDINNYTQIYGINASIVDAEQLAALSSRNINEPIVMVLGADDIKSTDKIRSIIKNNPNIKYLGLGNEVNLLFIVDSLKFEEYLIDYSNAYRILKPEFNNLKIFPVFQYESLIGKGKMLGKESTNSVNLITRFGSQIDLIGLTLYPHFDFDKPTNITSNYFADILNYNLPIGITETSWPSEVRAFNGDLEYLNTNNQEQTEYVTWVNSLDKGKIAFVNWLFLNDIQQNNQAFKGSGLRDTRGIEKEAFVEWKKLVQ